MSGGHLEKIGRPVVLENVSGGHFERKKEKKKRLLLPFFHRGRTLNMFFFLLCLIYISMILMLQKCFFFFSTFLKGRISCRFLEGALAFKIIWRLNWEATMQADA